MNKDDLQKRLDQITEIFAGMITHADELSQERCPYKNRLDECTAKFGCRNQREPRPDGTLLMCVGDDKLDYRSAWEMKAEGEEVTMGKVERRRPVRQSERTLFDLADDLALQVPTSCDRNGICHECICEVRSGMEKLGPRTEAESFLKDPFRLACQSVLLDEEAPIEFEPLQRTPKILSKTEEADVDLDPLVTRQGDLVFYDGEEIGPFLGHVYGIAVDLGTTTVVMDLVNLETGKSVHVSSFENPQRFGGSDVMNRISYDGQFPGELQKAIVNSLNYQIADLATRYGFTRREIYEIVVAGNSTMRDVLFRLDVQGIGQKPYKSTIENEFLSGERDSTALTIGTRRLGIRANPKARVYSLPLIASHVGADTAADLLAVGMDPPEEPFLLVDVGTNTEVVVGNNGQLTAASCPAGPAFEGGLIRYGMPGYEGAIESVKLEGDRFSVSTIGDVEPVGICGSGLIDLLAELLRNERMEPKGIFSDGSYEVQIVPDEGITLSREDASNLAQAKAANYCGQLIVLRHVGVNPDEIQGLYLAGGFANYVDVTNAIEIGFLASVPEDRIAKIGNAALQGSRIALLSRKKRAEVEELVKNIEHIELETTPDFFEIFVDGCQFKPMPKTIG